MKGDPVSMTEVEVRINKLKNIKVAGKDEFTKNMVKNGEVS